MSAAKAMPHRPILRQFLLRALATLFGIATLFYTGLWLYSVRWQPSVRFGMDYTFQPDQKVLRVDSVASGGAADRSGLRPGDHILAVNGHPLTTMEPYWAVIRGGKPGEPVELTVRRSQEPQPFILRLMLEVRPQPGSAQISPRTLLTEIIRLYPLPFLVVGLIVLFLRLEDRNAWLLAILFAGFIASAPLFPHALPTPLQRFMRSYLLGLSLLTPTLFYYFFAIFPVPSPIDRRFPWLKSVLLFAILPISLTLGAGSLLSDAAFTRIALLFSFKATRLSLTVLWIGCLLLGMISLASNARSAPDRQARRKIRMLAWGTLAGLIPDVLVAASSIYTGKMLLQYPFWVVAIAVCATLLFPISFAYVVVKHRVLELPILLKRSARYVLVQRGFVFLTVLWGTGFTGLFASVALSSARFLPWNPQVALWVVVGSAVGFGSLLALAGASLHDRVTRKIDRAFFRSAYDARTILQELGEQVRRADDRRQLATLLGQQVSSALHPHFLAIYVETRPGLLASQREGVFPECATLDANLPELAELARLGTPQEFPPDEPAGPARSVLAALQPECLVPILGREGRLIGLLALGPRLSEEPYSREDKRLLASVAAQAGIALENLQLAEQMAVRLEAERRAAHEMEIAKQVQVRLLPQKLPPLSTLEYIGGCVQAREVGGDYYDFLDLGPGRLGLVLADIAGKGISGALLMANLQANLRSQYAVALEDLSRLLASVNRLFHENTAENSFATMFFADYREDTRRLRYANCGHNPPYLIRAKGCVERLRATATVLGLFEDWECEVAEAQLNPGDLLVMYTDGITEATSETGEEFGEERLQELLLTYRQSGASELLDAVMSTVKRFGGPEQADDLTLVIARAR